jgi:uncharacterized secreted protein with C-terminal beta-propeller domain
MPRRRTVIAIGTVTAVVAGLGVVQLLPGGAPVARAEGLVPYTGCDQLLAHYRREVRASATPWGFGYGGRMIFGIADDVRSAAGPMAGAAEAAAPAAAQDTAAVGNGGTGTNLQEQGVDEPDVAKLRGGRLAVLAQGRLQIVTAESRPRVVGSLALGGPDSQGYGGELLLVGDRALVVAPGWRQTQEPGPAADSIGLSRSYLAGTPTTRLMLVDVSADQPRLLEEATYDAQYVSARLVDGTVRLVTTQRPQPQYSSPTRDGRDAEAAALAANQEAADNLQLTDVLPQYERRSAGGTLLGRGNAVSCAQTTHAQNPAGASTLLVTTLQPEHGLGPTDNDAVTTDGDLVYASADRLYVATSRWGTTGPIRPVDDNNPRSATATTPIADEVTTELHGFDTSSPTSTSYLGTGSVPGYVMGRWALSAHKGALRVATTRQPPWQSGSSGETSSMVVKLVEQRGELVETGRVEGLGKTERIQAVRYFGDVAAVVTFRQTDPLYLLDLSGTPKLMGELKVPGFSTYLHPIGDGKLLGLGQEASDEGRVSGMQMSVFDISDLSRPLQVDRLQLGPGWTPAMNDSRAFSYDPGRKLALMAFTSYDPTGRTPGTTGALGVRVDGAGQLSEVGRMTVHPTTPTNRVMVDAAGIYAVSDSGVVAGDPTTMQRTGAVDFPGSPGASGSSGGSGSTGSVSVPGDSAR